MGKAEGVCFSVDIMVCVMEIGSISTPLTPKGQGHLLTIAKGHNTATFSKAFFSETTGPIATKVYMQPPGIVCNNEDTFSPGHMTKMASMPIYGKNLKNLLIQNHWADCLETWYAASWALVLRSLYK